MKFFIYTSIMASSLLVSPFSVLAADTNSAKGSQSEASAAVPTAPASDDADLVITNRKMRAESGSKSRFSVASSLEYSAGTLDRPLASTRPNIRAATGTTDVARLAGTIGVKYSLNSTDALRLGIGIRWITPFEGGTPTGYNGSETDADNPVLTYQKMFRWLGGVQTVLQAGPTLYTASNLRNNGFLANWNLSLNNAYDLGKSGFTAGMLTQAGFSQFDKDSVNGRSVLGIQSDYYVGAYPFIEYVINDRFNIRTISGLFVYEHLRNQPSNLTFMKNKVYQSVGLGISVSRDIFLYPNIQFIPGDVRSDNTNLALSANINVL
jgi:hypothetical protein